MTPKTSNAPTLKTTTDLSALTHEIAKSVAAGGDTGQSKRSKHVEKAKVQQLTKQLAMRLQYAKLKVDHGWTRQNLDEVENLYFHHYRDRRPEHPPQQPKAPQRRIGAAPFPSSSTSASTSHAQVGVAGPSGSQSTPSRSTSPKQSTQPSTLTTQPTIVVNSVPEDAGPLPIGSDPSVYSVGPSPSPSSLPPQPSTSASVTRTASSPHPVARTNRQVSRSHPYAVQSNATASSSSSSLTTSPQKISAKKAGKAPVRGGGSSSGTGSKSLGKTGSKTSIPSTLQSPQIAESTTAARLAHMMGGKPTPGAGPSTSATVSTTSSFAGPTSYESFWNQLGSGGLGARTLASTSPSKSPLASTSTAPSLSATSSGAWNGGLTPTSSFNSSTSGRLPQPQPPLPTNSSAPAPTLPLSPSNMPSSSASTAPYHSLYRALQVTPEQLAASDARLNAATSQAQIGSYNPPGAAFVMSGSKVLDRLPPATSSNAA